MRHGLPGGLKELMEVKGRRAVSINGELRNMLILERESKDRSCLIHTEKGNVISRIAVCRK